MQYPHCDASVLHAPGECEYCDRHQEWQELRKAWGIAFTGRPEEGKLPDPASLKRPVETINKWAGNQPKKAEPEDTKAYCPLCPHAMFLHDAGGHCGSGCCSCNKDCNGRGDCAIDEPPVANVPPADWSQRETLHGTPIGEHLEIDPKTGMQKDYIVLSEAERSKGFVRPVRRSYRHVGPPGPKFPLRDLTAEEKSRYESIGYVKFEEWPKGYKEGSTGRFWTNEDLERVGKGCGTVTTMGQALAETWARDPHFYGGGTFCASCSTHLPVGPDGEFVWLDDGSRLGA